MSARTQARDLRVKTSGKLLVRHRRAMPWPRLICLVGIDGSGKTTLARALVERAEREGARYRYAWANDQPRLLVPLRELWRLLTARGRSAETDHEAYSEAKKRIVRGSSLLNGLYRAVHAADYSLWLLRQVGVPLLLGHAVVCDRYVHDVAVNQSLLLGRSHRQTKSSITTWMRLVPKPDVVFWIDVPAEVALRRKRDVPSLRYLEERRAVYRILQRSSGMSRLDGTAPPEELCHRAWDRVAARTDRRRRFG